MHPQTMLITAEIALHTSMWDRPFKALLMCIRAMFDLIAKDKFMSVVYMLFTLFLFCPEFLVELITIKSKDSIDEEFEQSRENY